MRSGVHIRQGGHVAVRAQVVGRSFLLLVFESWRSSSAGRLGGRYLSYRASLPAGKKVWKMREKREENVSSPVLPLALSPVCSGLDWTEWPS